MWPAKTGARKESQEAKIYTCSLFLSREKKQQQKKPKTKQTPKKQKNPRIILVIWSIFPFARSHLLEIAY